MKVLILSLTAWAAFLAYIPLQASSSTWARVLRIVLSGMIGGMMGLLIGAELKTLL